MNKLDEKIYNILESNTPQGLDRTQLCQKTGKPRTTVWDSLTRLVVRNKIESYSLPQDTPGRPKVFWIIRFQWER